MALILMDKEYVFNETIVVKDKNSKEAIFEMDIKLTEDEAQEIKEYMRDERELTKEEEARVNEILFNGQYDYVCEQIGAFKTEEFGIMLISALLGKLSANRLHRMTYASTKYQKNTKK